MDHASSALLDPAAALAALSSASPLLIGVRHHSAALAAAIPALLDTFEPDLLMIELPYELTGWLPWLAHPDTVAPVALSSTSSAYGLAFYPFADFSPELAAVRWARARGVPVEAFDLPLDDRPPSPDLAVSPAPHAHQPGRVLAGLLSTTGAPDSESLWDRLVETAGLGSTHAESVRRAALLYGWALRVDAGPSTRDEDRRREAYMRARLASRPGRRIATVIGTFHAAALLSDPRWDPVPRMAAPVLKAQSEADPAIRPGTALVAYTFAQLDSRSGYPAGIRDPRWHQRAWAARADESVSAGDATPLDSLAAEILVEVCREMRDAHHVAGTPDATEALRLAQDLARLRGLPGPGRRELLEAVESALGRGETLGRGRILARALESVMVGDGRGRIAPDAPRSGLVPHVEALLVALKLPGPHDLPAPTRGIKREPEPLRLDPLRSDLDRRRHVLLERLGAAGVSYGTAVDPDEDELTRLWRVSWGPAAEATLAAAGLWGVTLEQAATGALRAQSKALTLDERLGPAEQLDLLERAAAAGLHELVHEGLGTLAGTFLDVASLPLLVRAATLVEAIAAGRVPALPLPDAERRAAHLTGPGAVPAFHLPNVPAPGEILAAAWRAAEGLTGSDSVADARALLELVSREAHAAEFSTEAPASEEGIPEAAGVRLASGRVGWFLSELAERGTPLMQGVAGAAAVRFGLVGPAWLAERLGSWVDAAEEGGEAARTLTGRISGVVLAAAPELEASPILLQGLADRVAVLDDSGFLRRLPALRGGFDGLSPADRARLLHALAETLGLVEEGSRQLAPLTVPAELLAIFAEADRAAAAVREAQPDGAPTIQGEVEASPDPVVAPRSAPHHTHSGDHTIHLRDRWRLILGSPPDDLPPDARRYARALDELYGRGRGEGARSPGGAGAGHEAPFPTVREWADEVEALFGEPVREEVLGVSAARGDVNALLALDPDHVTPSVDILEQVLALKGGLGESQLDQLRRIVNRVVRELTEQLAVRVRPALTGLTLPRPTRRRTDRLDLRRTVAANLRTARVDPHGGFRIVPETLVFRTRGRRSVDWRIVLVVDTSGSMEPSVVHSALMAAILSALPAVQVHFLAFSTVVVDLSDRVDDPLALLLEVQIGGGTHIYKALRHARTLITVPSRSILLLVSDFEEGGPVGQLLGEVRTIVESGCRALGLASLDEQARPRYNEAIARQLVGAGMPVAALTPLELARWVGEQIR